MIATLTKIRPSKWLMVTLAALFALTTSFGIMRVVFAAPNAPQNVQLTPGNEQVAITWEAPESGEDPWDGYEVRYRIDGTCCGDGSWTIVNDPELAEDPTATSYTVEGLTNGTLYNFGVRALSDGTGNSAWTPDVPDVPNISAMPFTAPDAPDDFEAVAGDTEVVLSWEAPENTGGPAITGYLVRYATTSDPGDWTVIDALEEDADATGYTVTSLTNGTAYNFGVAALNGSGEDHIGTYATVPNITPYGVPAEPVSLSATPGNQQVLLGWEEPDDNGSPITGYEVQYRESEGPGSWIPVSDPDIQEDGDDRSVTITGLTNGTAYDFSVAAVNARGAGDPATHDNIIPRAQADVPQNISATPSDRQVSLAWDEPEDLGGMPLESYLVEYKLSEDDTWTDAHHDSTDRTATITGLTNGTAYTFRVAAVTEDVGAGGFATISATPFTNVPNNGDANGDGIPDSEQDNVTDLINPVTGNWAVLQSTCVNGAVDVKPESANASTDNGFNYPAGLMGFTVECGTPGATTTITQYYYGSYDAPLVVARKYNAPHNTYATIPGATAENVVIGGNQVLKVTYAITDGSDLDEDGIANGTIVDPSGPAFNTVGAPNTGLGGQYAPKAKQSLGLFSLRAL